jgi:hypothetical protein
LALHIEALGFEHLGRYFSQKIAFTEVFAAYHDGRLTGISP